MDNAAPPKTIPESMMSLYTCKGIIPVDYQYANDSYLPENPLKYETQQIDDLIGKARARQTAYYGHTDIYLYMALEKYCSAIQNKSVAVMGSVTPWYESVLLAHQAHPTTIEYNKIICDDPRLNILTVKGFELQPQFFDAVLSISSFEHDGLGRYGDSLDPMGDLNAMNIAKKMLQREGLLFLSVPVGPDYLIWNLHRIYGKVRLPMLLKGWHILDAFGFSFNDFENLQLLKCSDHQPLFVLKPKI
jgi:hypothetical protein